MHVPLAHETHGGELYTSFWPLCSAILLYMFGYSQQRSGSCIKKKFRGIIRKHRVGESLPTAICFLRPAQLVVPCRIKHAHTQSTCTLQHMIRS